MLFAELLLAVSSGVVVVTDIKDRKISNRICVLMLLCCIWLSLGNDSITLQFTQMMLVIAFGLALFALGVAGAGDVKLLSCFSLIISPEYFLLTLIVIGFIGGCCAIAILLKQKIRGHRENRGVPYAIPIVVSGLFFIHLSMIS